MAASVNIDRLNQELGWLLREQKLLSRRPFDGKKLTIIGTYRFSGYMDGYPEICQDFTLRFDVNVDSSFIIPVITELSEIIPDSGDYHKNADKSLCLGSPFDLYVVMMGRFCMRRFIEKCLDPYLYKVLLKLRGNCVGIIGGELPHGDSGILESFSGYFKLATIAQISACAKLIFMKRRIANKLICPCGCNRRVGQCSIHQRVNGIRDSMFTREVKLHFFGRFLKSEKQ